MANLISDETTVEDLHVLDAFEDILFLHKGN